MKLLKLLVVITLLPTSAQAYVYGYSRLFCPATQTTVDLVYDVHIQEKQLSSRDMKHKPIPYVKSKLFPTERQLIVSLEKLNNQRRQPITVIGESGPDDFKEGGRIPCLLAYIERFVPKRLSNLEYIHSDLWRFNSPNPSYPLKPTIDIVDTQGIIAANGRSVWNAYSSTFHNWHGFHSLADLEMLANLLRSPSKRIIVYAGGAHCDKIFDFLTMKAGYHIIATHGTSNYHSELSPHLLAGIEKDLIVPAYHRAPKRRNMARPEKGSSRGISCSSSSKKPSWLTPENVMVGVAAAYVAKKLYDNYSPDDYPSLPKWDEISTGSKILLGAGVLGGGYMANRAWNNYYQDSAA